MPVQFVPGAMFKVPAGDDFAYGVMLSEFPYIAFYSKDVAVNEAGSPVEPPMFVLLVAKSVYSTGKWGKAIRRLPDADVLPIPRFFWQDVTNKANCQIIDTVAQRRFTVTPSECVGLEPEAVWLTEHIEPRILDTYAGRPNMVLQSLQPKL